MIKMTRLRLINWHNFQDDTIDFKNITYLLGVNAVGKTTIMDAIRYCLTTNKDFNTAGNKKSGRTLLGSVHQKQRAEDSYLRPGHTVSYIGVEFRDDAINKTFVIIVRVESETPKQDLKGVTQDWYITKPGYCLEDIPFFTTVKEGKRPTSRDAFRLDNKGMDRTSNQTDARKRICRILGIGDSESPIGKKFNEVFHMGTSLEDIKDIREFIYTYILPEPEVNIEFLQKDMQELERLQEILQEAQEREKLLEQINERIIEAKERYAKVKVNELLVAYAEYQGNEEEQQENLQLIEQYKSSIEVLERKIAELSQKEKEAAELLYQAKKAAEDDEDNKELTALRKENESRKSSHETYCKQAAVYENLLFELKALGRKLSKSGIACEWDESVLEDVDVTEEEHLSEIRAARSALNAIRETIKEKDADFRTHIRDLEKTIAEFENLIAELSSGKMPYPKEALLVRDRINEALSAENKAEDARLLCEWLYMPDDSWQDAVESYLNTQRFNIIVAPENYLLAKKVFVSLGDSVKGIGLVDTRKLNATQQEEGFRYLSDTVESENVHAKRYVDYIMRGVVCCESADDLENHKKSVTKDRLRFQNFTLQRMSKQEHYIGVDAIQKRLDKTKSELASRQQELDVIKEQKKAFDDVSSSYDKFISGNKFEQMEEYSESREKAIGIQLYIEKTEVRIEELTKNPILRAMFDHVSECEENQKKISDKVAKLAELSSAQVEEVQFQREEYLLDLPDPDDENAKEFTARFMAASSIEIFNAYLPQIKELYLPVDKDAEYDRPFDALHNIRYINITKWVTDTKENSLEKLINVYAVLANEDCNIALVFNRTKITTNVYLAVVNTLNDDNNIDADSYKSRLIEAIKGNFPGSEWKDEGNGIIPCMNNDKLYSVATASNIPTEKSEKFVSQTIEKLLDGIIPDSKKTEYILVLLATPIRDIDIRKLEICDFYSGLTPYASWQTSYSFTDMQAFGSSATVGVNVGASAGIQNGSNYSIQDTDQVSKNEAQTNTVSKNFSESETNSHADMNSESHSDSLSNSFSRNRSVADSESFTDSFNDSITKTKQESDTLSGGANCILNFNYAHTDSTSEAIAKAVGKAKTHGKVTTRGVTRTLGEAATDTLTKGVTDTISKTVSESTGVAVANTLGRAVTKAMSTTSGISKAVNLGANFGANFARSSTMTATVGKNEGITQNFGNYNIKHALELLENQMKRFEQSTALGMWDFAAYVLSEDQNMANNVAHTYLALTLGEESYMSKSAINLWRGNVEEEKNCTKVISSYIRELRHPLFALDPDLIKENETYNVYPSLITATTGLSGKELAYSLNFPRKSISGLPIIECAEFGRNVVSYDSDESDERKINIGNIYHMNHEEKTPVNISLESLRSHAFITGSTGSGKSNTIYQMINRAREKNVRFMVVEPAKGEYKNVFGNEEDVQVYGTNPNLFDLLRLNPFSFPEKIHILEHLDRLVEIFNVCWPMYAAMPAVLKAAVEKAYKDCGWDLMRSVNKYDRNLYPEFADVARNIRTIIESSEYDDENKGAYKGALLTRLQSLANGINGMIFVSDEISAPELFDKNIIVDLSRVGSSETKSLIMGMLVLKLQEYRMASATEMNSSLKHITVLEEAHNILRRTSIEQSTESSNILGKSVEMLANSIAEMRTYGEGFIIADQAPGLMDMSVIRNTNTKIIMRLPDQNDRELVGKAANLNEDQITELAKLPCGVAAIYQNEWIQPVLCKVERYDNNIEQYKYESQKNIKLMNSNDILLNSLLHSIMDNELFQKGDKEDLRELKSMIIRSKLNSIVKVDFLDYLESDIERLETLRRLIYDLVKAEEAIKDASEYGEIHEWVDAVVDKLQPSIKDYSKKQVDLAMMLIIQEQTFRDSSYRMILNSYLENYKKGGGVF